MAHMQPPLQKLIRWPDIPEPAHNVGAVIRDAICGHNGVGHELPCEWAQESRWDGLGKPALLLQLRQLLLYNLHSHTGI